MTPVPRDERAFPLLHRLWIYQGERFPVFKTSILLAVFSAASVNVSAFLAGRDLPSLSAYAVAFLVSFIIFAQLRVCDEYKDFEDDQRYRPERPVPRGLISLRLVIGIGIALIPCAIVLTLAHHPPLVFLLGGVWFWLGLMTLEFFAPRWLKARPLLYLLSHMAIMPLLDLFVTGVEWLGTETGPAPALSLFLVLSFVNGCILEIGRKIWAPANEREGVDSYSLLWGVKRGTTIWLALACLSCLLLGLVGLATGSLIATSLPGLIMLGLVMWTGYRMVADPDEKTQTRMDTVSGLWVFVCYTSAGFAPLVRGWLV